VVEGYKGSVDINVWIDGGDWLSKWEVSDDAGWLKASPDDGRSHDGDRDEVTITVDGGAVGPGVHTATVTVSFDEATNGPITIPVTATVLEQVVKGPILVAADLPLLGMTGVGVSLITGGTLSTLVAISIDGLFSTDIEVADDNSVSGGVDGSFDIPDAEIVGGIAYDIGMLLPALSGNKIMMMSYDVEGDGQGPLPYAGIWLDDLSGVMDLLEEILATLTEKMGGELNPRGCITIPVGFMMDLLPTLLPLMEDILPSISPLLDIIMPILPTIVIMMPEPLLGELIMIIS
jgi:hypothetical protein